MKSPPSYNKQCLYYSIFFKCCPNLYRFFSACSGDGHTVGEPGKTPCAAIQPQILEWGNERRKGEAQFEAAQGMHVCAEDRDAVHLIDAFGRRGEAVVNGEAAPISGRACDLLDLCVDAAAGIAM